MPDSEVPSKPVEVPASKPAELRDKIALAEQDLVTAARTGSAEDAARAAEHLLDLNEALCEAEGATLTGDGTARP